MRRCSWCPPDPIQDVSPVTEPAPELNRRQMFGLGRKVSAPSRAGGLGRDRGQIVRVERPAMGSTFEIRLPASTPGAVDLACRALDLIDALEAQMTVYNDESEVALLNARAPFGPVTVEPGLFRLLETARDLSQQTAGAYDVTTGALSEAWGFVRGPRHVPDPESLAAARACSGWCHLRLDPELKTAAFDVAGMKINLGSIGKGYALDRAAALIQAYWWPTGALIHGGRSSAVALGSPPGQPGMRWQVALRNPFDPKTPLGVFRLRNRALGTSGSAFQSFESAGQTYGHILDPRTGEPARGPASVTVLAPTAALADALSTAYFLLGPDAAREHAANHPGIGGVFVNVAPTDRSPEILAFGLDEGDFVREQNSVH